MKVSAIYQANPLTIGEDATIYEAIQMMVEKKVNSLSVTNEAHHLVGIISLQDIAAATVPLEFQDNPDMAAALYKPHFFEEACQAIQNDAVKSIMRTNFITATPDTNVMEITADFLQGDLYVVPVVENNKIVGVITRSAIKKAFILAMQSIKE